MERIIAATSRLLARYSARRQSQSTLWQPENWAARINSSGHLEFDGVDLAELLHRSASPLLVVSRQKLHDDAKSFIDAVKLAFPNATTAYSYKTNCIPGVLRELHTLGMQAEVISPYELWLAEQLGMRGQHIVVNGVNKDSDFLEHAARLDVRCINIDSPREFEPLIAVASRMGRRINVGLRLKIGRKSHFGLDTNSDEAFNAAATIARNADKLSFSGLHVHELADNSAASRHTRLIGRALDFAADIRRRLSLETPNLDIGGGFSVPTTKVLARWEYARQRLFDVPAAPPDPQRGIDLRNYFAQLAGFLTQHCRAVNIPEPRLSMEPGRCITSRSHVLLSKVHSIKANSTGPAFAMTDIGKILVSYPCDYEYHQIFVANRMNAEPNKLYHAMGRLCTSSDWLARNRFLPELQANDVLAVMDAGAYFTSYASNFAYPRPAVVLLDKGRCTTLRRQESFEHLTAMDSAVDG